MLEVVVRRQSRSDVERDTQLGLSSSLLASVVGGTVVVSAPEANATTLARTMTMTTGNNDAKSMTGAVGTRRRRAVGLVCGDGLLQGSIIFISETCPLSLSWFMESFGVPAVWLRARGKIKK